jgi:protein MAK11
MQAEQGDKQQGLQRSFTHAAHKGVVKCVAAAGQYAASGGADDTIHLYDLKVRELAAPCCSFF